MKLQLLFLLLFLFVNAYSQYEYRPGYIVKLDGKTEEGLINFHGSEFNSKRCEFKKDIKADPVVYLPNDLIAYRLTDSKYFVSKRLLIENTDTLLFIECLISGKATIYYTQLNSREHYFLEKDSKLVEMNNNLIDVITNIRDYSNYSNQYKGILKYYLRDCPQMSNEIDNADFSKKSLIKISKEYHDYMCKDEQCIIYEKKIPKKRILWGIDFSYGTAKLEFANIHARMSMKPTTNLQFGINSQMNLDEEGAFNLKVALRYYSYKNDLLNVLGAVGSYVGSLTDIHYQYSMLKPEVQLKYKMKVRKIVPFVSAGMFTNFFLSEKGYIRDIQYDERTNILSNGNSSMNWMFGLVGEIGLETKLKPGNLSFSFFYESFLNIPFSSSNNLGLRCGYSFYF